MKRWVARAGLTALAGGTPAILYAFGGPPRIPAFDVPGGLSSTYVPLDPVLQVVALAAWAVWGYLVLAILLRAASLWAESHAIPGRRSLAIASTVLIPAPLRGLLDVAIGGAILASSLLPQGAATPPASRPVAAVIQAENPQGHRVTAPSRSYEVRPGDSLWRIAERELGSGFKWREIFALNKGRQFPDGRILRNPRLIFPGWGLLLPTHELSRPAPRVAKIQEQTRRPDVQPSLRVVREQAPPPTPTRAAHPTTSVAEELHATRPPVLTAPSKPTLTLPSGVIIAASFGCGLLSAELLARLRRRRARRLDGPLIEEPETESREPSLVRELRHAGATPTASRLDVAVEALVETWRSHRDDLPQILAVVEETRVITAYLATPTGPLPPRAGGRMRPEVAFDRADGVVRVTIRGPFPPQLKKRMTPHEIGILVPLGARRGLSAHASALTLGGLSIDGPEAHAVLKPMILSLAASATPDDLNLFLIGDVENDLARLPHVARSAQWEQASELLQDIQSELIRRARLRADEGPAGSLADELLPTIAIIATEPPASLRGIIEAIGQEATKLGGTLFAIGWRPEKTSLHILVDETLHLETGLPLPRQLQPFLLDEARASDAVRVIIESREDSQDPPTLTEQTQYATPVVALPPETASGVERNEETPLHRVSSVVPSGPLAVRCLGHFEVSRGEEVLADGWRKKSRELLAYLVAHETGAPKERIIEDLWPGEDARRVQKLFELAVSFLRTHVRTDNETRYIEKVGDSFRMEARPWSVDVWEFSRLADEGLRSGDPRVSEDKLRAALALYKGEFCDDAYYDWAEPVRERYRTLFVRACGRLADILSKAGGSDEALAIIDTATEIDPLCEDLWRRAMLAEIDLGRSAAALERYGRLKSLLAKELDIEPDPETQQIARGIEVSLRR